MLISSGIVKQASKLPNCNIVSIDWLLESHEAKKPLAEKKYLFDSNSNSASTTKNDNESQDQDEDDKKKNGDKPDTDTNTGTTTTTRRSTKKRALAEIQNGSDDKDKDESKSNEDKPTKKLKDGQKAVSKSVNVEVDEVCHMRRRIFSFLYFPPLSVSSA